MESRVLLYQGDSLILTEYQAWCLVKEVLGQRSIWPSFKMMMLCLYALTDSLVVKSTASAVGFRQAAGD